jgi:hypothetical protein
LIAEWDGFTQHFTGAGIRLQKRPDALIWTGGDSTGFLTAKNVYHALATKFWTQINESWRQKIWKGDCPLKLKLFFWLLIENKLLVWENLQIRGWEGPNRCILCKQYNDSINHIFLQCNFIRSVWHHISLALNLATPWTGPNVPLCFRNWLGANKNHSLLPVHLCWHVWNARNTTLFEERLPSIQRVVNNILAEVATSGNQTKSRPPSDTS